MTPTEERLHQLKSHVLELQITAEEKKLQLDILNKLMNSMGKLNLTDSKNWDVFEEFSNNYINTQLDYLRDKISIIQKVSPKTAKYLEIKVNDYEKSTRTLFESWNKSRNSNSVDLIYDSLKALFQFMNSSNKLQDLVDMSANSFLDTIDYLEGNKVDDS